MAAEPPGVAGDRFSPAWVDDVGAVLAALADATRRQLLDVLVDVGRASATTLAGRLPVSRQAVVKHLQVLEAAGLVERGRAGREVLYSARSEPLEASARWFTDLSAAWDRRLDAIKQAAEEMTAAPSGASMTERPDERRA